MCTDFPRPAVRQMCLHMLRGMSKVRSCVGVHASERIEVTAERTGAVERGEFKLTYMCVCV